MCLSVAALGIALAPDVAKKAGAMRFFVPKAEKTPKSFLHTFDNSNK